MDTARWQCGFVSSLPVVAGGSQARSVRGVTRRDAKARPVQRRRCVVAVAVGGEFATTTDEDAEVDRRLASDVTSKVDSELGSGPLVMLGNLSSAARKGLVAAACLGAGALGYTQIPTEDRNIAIGASVVAVGATAVGSTAVLQNAKRLSKRASADVLAALGPRDPNLSTALLVVKEEFEVEDLEWQDEMRDLYAMYFMEMVSGTDGEASYREISLLMTLRNALGLTGPEVGDAHFEVGRQFYRENVIYLGDPEGGPAAELAQRKLNKLLFLSDRMFADKETEEAYMYESARLRKHFGMDEDDYKTRVASIADTFYGDCVIYAINHDEVSEADLKTAQSTLGIADPIARGLEEASYSEYVQELVAEYGEVGEDDVKELSRLQKIFNISSDRAEDILKRVATPEFTAAVKSGFDGLFDAKSAEEVKQELATEREKLQLSADLTEKIIAEEMKTRLQPALASAIKFLRVSNVFASATEVSKLLTALKPMMEVVSLMFPDEDSDDLLQRFFEDNRDKLREAPQLYSIYLQELLKRDGKVTGEEKINLAKLKIVLGLSSLAADDSYRKATGPMYKRQLTGVFAADKFDDEAHAILQKVQDDLTLPDDTAHKMKLEAYTDRLRKYVKDTRILTNEEAMQLSKIRSFLALNDEEAMAIHANLCSGVYEQAIIEAMGSSGLIMENVWDALGRLRERLFISDEAADNIFYAVCKGRMRGFVMRAWDNLEKKRGLRGMTEQKDVGDDPFVRRAGAQLGIDATGLNVELHNLVDFYVRNRLMKISEIESEEDGETKVKRVAEFPVTLRGAIQLEQMNELYKQYLIQCFSAKSREEKERLFGVLDQLASILGLEQAEVDAIHSDIGSVIYKNYIGQALLQGNLEEKDMQFLTNIQSTLAMTPRQCNEIMNEAKKSRISVLLEQTIARQSILPENAKKVRTTAEELGVDIVDDLKVPLVDRLRVFKVEVDTGIEAGTITANNRALIREAKDGWQIPEEDAKKVLLDNIEMRCSTLLVQAASSVRQGNQENAVRELSTMLKFGRLLPAEVASPVVSDAEKQELLLLYQAYLITDSALNEEAKKDISLLTTMLGISDEVLQGA